MGRLRFSYVWRNGFFPAMSTASLAALRRGIERADAALAHGQTTEPPDFVCYEDCLPLAACAVCYAGWKGDGLQTVGELSQYFFAVCAHANARLGGDGECAPGLNYWDFDNQEARRALLPLLEQEIARRQVEEHHDEY